jgi:hypothetical protein
MIANSSIFTRGVPKAHMIMFGIVTLWVAFLAVPVAAVLYFVARISGWWVAGSFLLTWYLYTVAQQGQCDGIRYGAEQDEQLYVALLNNGAFHFGPRPQDAELLRRRLERNKIINDFGAFIERNPCPPTRIVDVSVLPHRKEQILEALLLEIPHEVDPKMKDCLKVGATSLSQYQPGVGEVPLEMLGMDFWKLPVSKDPAVIRMLVEAEARTRPRYEEFKKLVTKDLNDIEAKISAAERKGGSA